MHEAEKAALTTLVALVMKLSEARFRPMFLRLVEWSASAAADQEMGVEGAGRGRAVALFGAAGALTERLRSVFVPYFRWVVRAYLFFRCVVLVYLY